MKHLATLASLAAIAWVLITLSRMKRSDVPWTAVAYLFVQFAFTWVNWAMLISGAKSAGASYARLYDCSRFGLALGMIVCLTAFLRDAFPGYLGDALIFFGFGFALMLLFALDRTMRRFYGGQLPDAVSALFGQGLLSVLFGVLILVSMASTATLVENEIRLHFGGFWILIGITSVLMAFCRISPRLAWMAEAESLAPLIALLCFSGLAFNLGQLHSEFSPQQISKPAAMPAPGIEARGVRQSP